MSDTIIQSRNGGSGSGTTIANSSAVGYASTTTAGNCLVCVVFAEADIAAPTISAPVTSGFTWSQIASVIYINTLLPQYGRCTVYYIPNAGAMSATTTVQASKVGAFYVNVEFELYELGGIATASPVDYNAFTSSGSGGDPATASLSTTGTDFIFVTCLTDGASPIVGSGYTLGKSSTSLYSAGRSQYILNDAAGTIATAFGSTAAKWGCVAVAFKNGSGSVTASPIGVSATSAVNSPSGRGDATASPAGVSSISGEGIAVGSLAYVASPAGVRAMASVGTAIPSFTWNLNFGNAVVGSSALPIVVNTTYFYARFVGYLIPSVTGDYIIGVNASGGSDLYLSGTPIFNALSTKGVYNTDVPNSSMAYTRSGTIALTKGVPYPLVLEWQHGAAATYEMQLLWTPPNGAGIQIIPMTNVIGYNNVPGLLNSSWWNGAVTQTNLTAAWFPMRYFG